MKEIEIPEGYEARIEGNKVIIEPKESEDERIRERLIDCLKFSLKGAEEQDAAGCSRQKDIEAYKWGITYLENHKEQKPVPKFSVGDYVIDTNYKGEPLYQIVGVDKECYICEYRGDKEMGDRAVMHFAFDNPYLRLKQKLAEWSEQDEIMLLSAIEYVQSYPAHRQSVVNWLQCKLKSFRPQPHFADVSKMPKVDLEKELENFARQYPMEHSGSYRNLMTLARHFFELGKNSRKEE